MRPLKLIGVLVLLLYSCRPSAEEKAKTEMAKQDSIRMTEKMYADSMAAANIDNAAPDTMMKSGSSGLYPSDGFGASRPDPTPDNVVSKPRRPKNR